MEIILVTIVILFPIGLCAYIWTSLVGVRFYWRWLIFLLVFGVAWLICSLAGAFRGNFNSNLTTEYRSHFWKEFILTVKTTPDFSSSVAVMQKKVESPEFSLFKEKILPKYPSVILAWAGILLLAGAIGLEFWKKPPWNRIGVLVLTLATAGLGSCYGYQSNFVRYSRYHLKMTCGTHQMMLDIFSGESKQIQLSQNEIADAMRNYSEQWRVVCHGEPYTELMIMLPEKEKVSASPPDRQAEAIH